MAVFPGTSPGGSRRASTTRGCLSRSSLGSSPAPCPYLTPPCQPGTSEPGLHVILQDGRTGRHPTFPQHGGHTHPCLHVPQQLTSASLPACLPASLPPCLLASLPACLLASLLPCLLACHQLRLHPRQLPRIQLPDAELCPVEVAGAGAGQAGRGDRHSLGGPGTAGSVRHVFHMRCQGAAPHRPEEAGLGLLQPRLPLGGRGLLQGGTGCRWQSFMEYVIAIRQ